MRIPGWTRAAALRPAKLAPPGCSASFQGGLTASVSAHDLLAVLDGELGTESSVVLPPGARSLTR